MMRTTAVTRWGIAAFAFALLGVLAAWGGSGPGMFSPGELSSAATAGASLGGVTSHAELADDCGACHASPWGSGTMNARCLACHTDVQAELPDSTTLHGGVPDAEACRSCHTEHQGRRAVLTRMDGGVEWHDRFAFSIVAHRRAADGAPLTCRDCHARDGAGSVESECRACHDEYLPERMAGHVRAWGEACLACHDGVRFAGPFDHSSTEFALAGEHARIACEECHQAARSRADFGTVPGTCEGCHLQDDPHGGDFGGACGECHSADAWEPATFAHDVFPVGHGTRGDNACDVCHRDAPRTYESYTCYGCHEHSPAGLRVEHREEGVRDRDIQDCVRCHNARDGRGELGEEGEHDEDREHRRRREHEEHEDDH